MPMCVASHAAQGDKIKLCLCVPSLMKAFYVDTLLLGFLKYGVYNICATNCMNIFLRSHEK
jgi:hypothetical protein